MLHDDWNHLQKALPLSLNLIGSPGGALIHQSGFAFRALDPIPAAERMQERSRESTASLLPPGAAAATLAA
ncbi:hypothetical protein [Sorangium sp. So ce233]|uniref:hypothetical protein n=1 Tax=Sorangium sp. So ce233 TaxID=3133290 RepID=UPI003F6343C5